MTARNKNVPALRFKEFKDSWNEVKLGEGIDLVSGLHLSPDEYNKNKSGMPYFTGPSDFTNDESKVTKWSLNSTNYGLKRDVLFTVKGSGVGTMSLLQLEKVAMGRQLMAIRSRKFDSEFVYHFLFKKSNYFVALASGNMIPGLSRQDILTLKLDIPSLPEQQKIASFLSAIDEKIRQLTRRKELLEQYKKGVMQQLFSGKLRFKPAPHEIAGDEKGKAYPKWEEKKLGEVGDIVTGKTPSTSDLDLWGGEIQFITPTDIDGNKYQVKTQRTITKLSTTKILPSKSIIFTCIASIGKMSLSVKPCITNQQINSIIPFKEFENEYIYYSLLNIVDYIKSTQSTTTLPIINKTEFSKIKIQVPTSFKEQQKIASFLSSIDSKIESVNAQIEGTKGYKKGLLQKMFV